MQVNYFKALKRKMKTGNKPSVAKLKSSKQFKAPISPEEYDEQVRLAWIERGVIVINLSSLQRSSLFFQLLRYARKKFGNSKQFIDVKQVQNPFGD
jgi:hypothetical protein